MILVTALYKFYHMVTNNINNKYQRNDAIEYEPKFDSKFSLSSGTKYPLPVVSVSFRGGRNKGQILISGLTCLWYIGANNIMIKRRHTKPYDRKMCSNKVEYSTSVGTYYTTHDSKLPF